MKIKIFLIICLIVLLVACNKTTKLVCTTPVESYTFILENGQVIKYLNDKNVEQSQSIVNGFNKDYLEGVKTNKNAVSVIKSVVKGFDGTCK